ncbi:MAG: type II secretion system F family protein, partial [Actinomycetota bacterium]
MIGQPHRGLHSSWLVRLAALALLAATVIGTMAPGAGGQTEDEAEPTPPRATPRVVAVDATGDEVAVELIGIDPADAASGAVQLTVEGEPIEPRSVTNTAADDRGAEVVLVVDAHVRGAAGDVVDTAVSELWAAAEDLPATTSVAVVSAGDGALIVTRPTNDLSRVATGLADIGLRNFSALYGAVDRGAGLFTDDPDTVKTMIVVATGADSGSAVSPAEARVSLLQHGAQLVAVGYGDVDDGLATIAEQTAGLSYTVNGNEDLGAVLADVTTRATTRTVVRFVPGDLAEARTNVEMTVGEQAYAFSYPADVRTVNPLQLAPEVASSGGSFALFQTSVGLYLALGLAFVGISLGVWSLGSIMAGGEAGLEGMLARYTDGESEPTDAEVEDLVVQSALLQRAVDLSESFAERQGFLARAEDLLERANLPVRAGEAMFILGAIVLLIFSLSIVITRSILAALLLAVFAAALSFFVVRFLGRRRFKTFESQLPDTLQLLSGTLRAGYSLPQGMEAVSNEIADPMGQELRRAMTEARLGRDMEDALTGVADRMASPDFAWTVMAIGIQREVGGNLNELLMSVSDTMVQRDRLKREISALTAEGKMSAGVLSFLTPRPSSTLPISSVNSSEMYSGLMSHMMTPSPGGRNDRTPADI